MKHAKCSQCGQAREDHELNGVDPLADSAEEKYQHAYCRNIADCNSAEAEEQISDLAADLTEETAPATPDNPGTIYYKVNDDPGLIPLKTDFDIEVDGDFLATEAAQDYFNNHDGWEAHWPVTIGLYRTTYTERVAAFTTHMNMTPVFSADQV